MIRRWMGLPGPTHNTLALTELVVPGLLHAAAASYPSPGPPPPTQRHTPRHASPGPQQGQADPFIALGHPHIW